MRAIEYIEKFADKVESFRNNLQLKYIIFDTFTKWGGSSLPLYAQIPSYQLDGLIRRELEQIEDTTALTAFLFARMNVFNVNLIQQQNLINQQQEQIKKLQEQLQQAQNSFQSNKEDIFKM